MSFEEDYPAAHSMDTTWFAVDKDGFIACMESNEDGPVPVKVTEDMGYLLDQIASLTKRTLMQDSDRIVMPSSIGVYSYSCWSDAYPGFNRDSEEDQEKSLAYAEDLIVFPYCRTEMLMPNGEWKGPEQPLNIKDLSAELKKEMQPMLFDKVRFAEADWLQPALVEQCQFWTFDEGNPRAIDTDGSVVAIPLNNIDPRNLKTKTPPGSASGGAKPWWKKLLGRH